MNLCFSTGKRRPPVLYSVKTEASHICFLQKNESCIKKHWQFLFLGKYLTKFFKGKDETILGLAGVGDLFVSAAGGRNSKMGSYLGKGFTFKTAKKRFMPYDTVEGEQLAREIAPFIFKKVNKNKVPMMINLLRTIINNKKLKIKV